MIDRCVSLLVAPQLITWDKGVGTGGGRKGGASVTDGARFGLWAGGREGQIFVLSIIIIFSSIIFLCATDGARFGLSSGGREGQIFFQSLLFSCYYRI